MSGEIFIDSNIWIYALSFKSGEEARQIEAARLISSIKSPVISEQVIAEVSYNLLKKTALKADGLLPILESLYQRCRVIAPDFSLHAVAHTLRQRYRFSFWDSMVVAAAKQAKCTRLYTEDMQHGLVVEKTLTIFNPFNCP